LVALALAACGGDDETTPAATTTTSGATGATGEAAVQEAVQGLSDEQQIKRVGAAWAEPYSQGDKAMCEYLHFDIEAACSIYTGPNPSEATKSFEGAKVESVEVNGKKAIAQFSNGEAVEFTKDPNDEWEVSNLGGNVGR
jgi:hypothetical protein